MVICAGGWVSCPYWLYASASKVYTNCCKGSSALNRLVVDTLPSSDTVNGKSNWLSMSLYSRISSGGSASNAEMLNITPGSAASEMLYSYADGENVGLLSSKFSTVILIEVVVLQF